MVCIPLLRLHPDRRDARREVSRAVARRGWRAAIVARVATAALALLAGVLAGVLAPLLAPLPVAAAAPLGAFPAPDASCTSGTLSGYGQSIVVSPATWICGDASAYGGSVTVDGHVSGNVSAFGGGVTVAGQVDGNVVAVGGDVTLEPGARVGGDVDSWGGSVHRATDTLVSGAVDRGQWVTNSFSGNWPGASARWAFPWPWILVWSLLAVIIVTLFPERTARVRTAARHAAVRSVSVGLLTAILGSVLAAVLFATCVGIPISLLVVAVLLVGWALGTVAVGLGVGSLVFRVVAPRARSPLLRAVVGVVLLGGVESIPCVGGAIAALVSLLGLGATLLSRFGSPRFAARRRLPAPTPPQ